MKRLFLLALGFGLVFLQSCGSKDSPVSIETTGSISGKVIDTNGTPVTGAIVSSSPPSSQVLTTSDGIFTLSDLAPGIYTVLAEKNGAGSGNADVNVAARKTTTATIVLSPEPITTGVISGQVVDGFNMSVSDAYIFTIPPSKTTTTNVAGNFSLVGIQPGSYSVIATKNGFKNGTRSTSVTVGSISHITIQLGVAAALPTEGLLAYYKLEGEGNDYSGNNRPLLITNATFIASRDTGLALSFSDGAKATALDDSSLNLGEITISLWLKTIKPSVESGTGVSIISKYAGPSTFNGYLLWFNGPDFIFWTQGVNKNNLAFSFVTNNAITDNRWHSIICTTDSAGCRLFFEGVLVHSGPWTGIHGRPTTKKGIQMGDDNNKFTGAIDDVRIYNRVLSLEEIRDLANEP